jgi:hypothetical protein
LWGRSHPGTTGNGDRGDIHRAPGDAPFAPPVVEFVPVQHDAHEGPPTQRRDWDVIPRAAWLALARRHRPGWPRPSGAPVPDQDLIRTCDDIVQQLFAIGLAMRTIPAALQRPSGGGRPDHRAHNDLQRVIRQIHGAVLDPGPLCRGPTFGFDLMPRVRNWRDLNFYRPSPQDRYRHVDALFGEPGRNVIDWELIENHYLDVMRVVLSIQEGKISSVTLMRRLSTYSRRNNFYKAFREIGRVIRTVQLLRFLSDPQLRRRTTAETNKVESYNRFSAWCRFGNAGVIADNDPEEQEKILKFSTLLTNAVIFHTTLDMMTAVRELIAEGRTITEQDLAVLSPYLTARIQRFGVYATDELALTPEPFDARLAIDLATAP